MKKILLTFLGTNDYKACRYTIDNFTSQKNKFFSAALAEWLRPDLVISLETSKATAMHGKDLEKSFAELSIEHHAAPIPEGKSETELWDIFTALTGHLPQDIPKNCELYLDITHGFRSLPVIGFLALNFLRVARQLNIGGVYYGAFDPLEFKAGINLFPTFDLTPFLTLLEWTSGAEQFFRDGSTSLLSSSLNKTQQNLWQAQELSPGELPRKLKSLGQAMLTSSESLLLLRTRLLEKNAQTLNGAVKDAILDTTTHAKPFTELLDPITKELTQFADTDLSTLRDLIAWLTARGKIDSALTLASEWVTSYVIVHTSDQEHHTNGAARDPFSAALACLSEGHAPKGKHAEEIRVILEKLDQNLAAADMEKLQTTTSQIRHARNDLNHAGFNERNSPPSNLKSLTADIVDQLVSLPLP